jgi:putative transposase
MARPYSMDLRERAVARVQAGESVRVIARALSISPSSVVKWAPRFRATGSAAAGKMGGHRPRLLAGEHADFLRERIAQGGFTLRRLVAELAARGLKVDYRTVWSFVRSEGLSFKKKPFCQVSKTGRTSPASGRAGKPIRGGSIRGGSSSSMRPGPRPTWLHCADGVCAERGSTPKPPTATGRR